MKWTLRHTGYVIVFLLLGAVTVQSFMLSSKINKLNEANNSITIIKEQLNHKQDSIDLLSLQSITLKARADSLGVVVNELQEDNEQLSNVLHDALTSIDSIPAEENYVFLKDTAYNYSGPLEFPFNAKQVTEIRKTYVENDAIKKINVNLNLSVSILKEQVILQDSVINNQYVQLHLYSDMIDSLKDIVDQQEEENNNLNKQVVLQKRLKNIFQGTTLGSVLLVIIVAL